MEANVAAQSRSLRLTVISCVRLVLLRVVRLAIKYGIQWPDFRDMTQQLYVSAAREELERLGFDSSVNTRVQALTGIYRKKIGADLSQVEEDFRHPFNDLLSEWSTNPRYQDGEEPAELPCRAVGAPSFEELAKKHFRDLPFKSVLEQLEVSGNAKAQDGWVRLLDRFVVPGISTDRRIGDQEKHLRSAMHAASNMLMTAATNIERIGAGQRALLVQSQYWGDNVPKAKRLLARSELNELASDSLRKAEAICEARDEPRDPFDTTFKVGLGVYVFETPIPPNKD